MSKPSTSSPTFELVTSADAATEKQLTVHKKAIKVYAEGVRKSGAQMFGYAYLAGREMNLVKASGLIPHGKFEKWVEASFPQITDKTARNWRDFAEAIDAKVASLNDGKRETVSLLSDGKPGAKPKKKLSKSEENSIIDLVRQVMDGKGMIEFMRSSQFMDEPTPAGGFRPNAELLEAWLKEHHPELCGKSWDELPKEIQDEVEKADLRNPTEPTATAAKESADFAVKTLAENIRVMISSPSFLPGCSNAELNALEEARLELGRKIAEIKAKRK